MIKTNKTLENTIYAEDVEEQLFGDIEKFMNSEAWYAKMGIPYKRGYFLYSTPGQGKTSVAKILANRYCIPIFCLDLTTIDDNATLTKLTTEISYHTYQEKYILLIEDADRTDFISRGNRYGKESNLSMDCFLNAIDGVAEPHGRLLLMSANNPENILENSALMRAGRIDKSIEIKACNKSQLQRMYKLFYEDHPYVVDWDAWEFNETLSAAYVIRLLQENVDRPEVFMHLIGEAKTGDDKDIPLDETFQKTIELAKSEQMADKLKNDADSFDRGGRISRGGYMSRSRSRSRGRRNRGNKIEDKISRAKETLKRDTKRAISLTKSVEKAESKLPILLDKLKKKRESEKLKKLKEKAANRIEALKARKAAQQQENDLEYCEDEYETPAFLVNSIAIDDVIPGTITTYETMDTIAMEDEYQLQF